jgi:hypothetical protein
VELVSHTEPKLVSNGKASIEKVSVNVCGKKETFEVRRIQVKEGQTLVVARRI